MIKAFALWNKRLLETTKNKSKTNTVPGLHQFMLPHARLFLELSVQPMEIAYGYRRI